MARIIVGSSTMIMLLVAPIVLVAGSQSHHPSPRTPRGPPQRAAAALMSTASEDVNHGSPAATAGAAPAPAPVVPPAPGPVTPPPPVPAHPVLAHAAPAHAAPAPNHSSTTASWYRGRPQACHDHNGKATPLPAGLTMWTAARTLPCGTKVEVDGQGGRTVLLVEDHGPWVGPGRELDMSPAAFEAVVGPLAIGTATVTFWVVAPA